MKKNSKKFRKIVVFVMALVMVLSSVPLTAAASPTTQGNRPITVRFNCKNKKIVTVKDLKTKKSSSKSIKLKPGRTYEVKIKFSNYCPDESHYTIVGARCYGFLPKTIEAKKSDKAFGGLTGINADEKFQSVVLKNTGKNKLKLSYVKDSAKIHSGGAVNGQALDGAQLLRWGHGVYIGYDSLNGKVPGLQAAEGYVTFKFKVTKAKAKK